MNDPATTEEPPAALRPGPPPFRALLKSREVEDPINLWVHRPLAYAFMRLVYPTPMTPNMVTALATMVGFMAGACFLRGTPEAMLLGGALVWISAILDGADGFVARAKNMHSEFGRALDGTADMVVAGATVFPAIYHMAVQQGRTTEAWLGLVVLACTLVHLPLYDFYKESYLRFTRPRVGGEGHDLDEIEREPDGLDDEPWAVRMAYRHAMMAMLQSQKRYVRWTNPAAWRRGRRFVHNDRSAAIYRKHNRFVMQGWAAVSLAPHCYLFAMFAMADSIHLYVWLRLIVINLIFVGVVLWQRRATRRTLAELSAAGLVEVAADGPAIEARS